MIKPTYNPAWVVIWTKIKRGRPYKDCSVPFKTEEEAKEYAKGVHDPIIQKIYIRL